MPYASYPSVRLKTIKPLRREAVSSHSQRMRTQLALLLLMTLILLAKVQKIYQTTNKFAKKYLHFHKNSLNILHPTLNYTLNYTEN
jgi:hypothetical protein